MRITCASVIRTFRSWAATLLILSLVCAFGGLWRREHQARQEFCTTALFEAAWQGDAHSVEQALAQGINLEAREEGSNVTPLMAAARRGRTEVIELLLGHGANVNATSPITGTALSGAARFGRAGAIRVLLAHGADPNATTSDGQTPLLDALYSDDATAAVDLLLGAGARVDARNGLGTTPLMVAAMQGNDEAARRLLEAGADITVTDHQGHDASEIAAAEGYSSTVKLITEWNLNQATYPRTSIARR